MRENKKLPASMDLSTDPPRLQCAGNWTITQIARLQAQWLELKSHIHVDAAVIQVDGSRIGVMDSTGALFFQDMMKTLGGLQDQPPAVLGLNKQCQSLLDLIALKHEVIHEQPVQRLSSPTLLYQLGVWTVVKCQVGFNLLSFVGELFVRFVETLKGFRHLSWAAVCRIIAEAGCAALPLVGLLTFLVGIVLTYQIAIQLSVYNMNIFIVDITGMVILREFGPLITAIIAAGRTSTAFASEIGTMVVNEEVAALRTMGLSSIQQLVLPKLLGVLIAFPLLTIWADAFGVLGSMLMSNVEMDISFRLYLERFEETISVQQFLLGMVKAPIFALIIAIVGCFQGFSVGKTAESVGRHTMQSAVQSIFLVIIVDALFSLLASW